MSPLSVVAPGPASPPGAVVGSVRRGHREITVGGVRGASGALVSADTCFDLASVTKVIATTCLLHRLATLGQIRLDDPVSRYLPWSPCRASTTLKTLAWHRAGLWEWQPLYLSGKDPVTTLAHLPLRYEPDQARHYSDLGFMLLGLVIEAVTSTSLDQTFTDLIARPLGLTRTGYAPVRQPVASGGLGDDVERQMVADQTPYPILFDDPSFAWRQGETLGEANDGNAFHSFSGVAGHAGLFSCAEDLLTLLSSLADEDSIRENRRTTPQADSFSQCEDPFWGDCRSVFSDGPDYGQAVGWRSMRVDLEGVTRRMLWHPGFTGCAVGFIPGTGFAAVMLTNRLLAPDPPGTVALWEQTLNDIDALSDWRIP